MAIRSKCELHIPYKDIAPSDAQLVHKYNENMRVVEQWAYRLVNQCMAGAASTARLESDTAIALTAGVATQDWDPCVPWFEFGATTTATGLIVCDKPGIWQVNGKVHAGADDPPPTNGWIYVFLFTTNSVGAFYDVPDGSHSHRSYANIGGSDIADIEISMEMAVPEVNGQIGVSITSFNADATASLLLGAHFVHPDFELQAGP